MEQDKPNIIIVKKPRSDPIPDKPINFPPLENLHLELLENKRKLKHGVPAVPIPQKRKPPVIVSKESSPVRSKEPVPSSSKDKSLNPSKSKTDKPKEKLPTRKSKLVETEDDDFVSEFGDDDVDNVELEFGESEDEEEFRDRSDTEEPEIDDGDLGSENLGDGDENVENPEDDIYAGLSPEEREQKEREEYIWRFRILKKQYRNPKVTIPEYNEHSDVPEMKRVYDRTIRELYLDDAVDSYRTYMMGGFMAMEFICTQFIGVDLGGFTVQQTRMMYKYDRLLVELGEKSYTKWGMNLPVEIRLIGLILLQAGVFYLGKVITAKYGSSMADLFKGITGQPPDITPEPNSSNQEAPVKKMRGPKIKAEDIRKMSHAKNVD